MYRTPKFQQSRRIRLNPGRYSVIGATDTSLSLVICLPVARQPASSESMSELTITPRDGRGTAVKKRFAECCFPLVPWQVQIEADRSTVGKDDQPPAPWLYPARERN